MLAQSQLTQLTLAAVKEAIAENGWEVAEIVGKIQQMTQSLEKRNRKVIGAWENALGDE
jgi:ABC-type transporter Mla subunit MlaD